MLQETEVLKDLFGLIIHKDEELRNALTDRIHYLIMHDQHTLISMLYRLDINENILKQQLETNEDAGTLIANMIIERQQEKQRTRNAYRQDANDIPEEDRW